MVLLDTVNIIGATAYFIFAVLLAWLSRVPRTNPGAGWWATAIFFGMVARLALLLPFDFFSGYSREYIYGVFILMEKCFLLLGVFRFLNLPHYSRPYLAFIGTGLIWIAICTLTDISRLVYSFGLGLFNSAALFFFAVIAYREHNAMVRKLALYIASVCFLFGIHWLTYPVLRLTDGWIAPGFLIGTLLALLEYLGLISAVLLQFQKRLMDAEYNALELAYHDPLTGLNNQRYMTTLFEQALLLATRPHQRLAVIYIDLDNFKPINDTDGHLAGDEVLKTIAKRLVDNTRSTDICARMGGDEFVVIATQLESEEHAHQIAEKLLQQCCNPVDINNKKYHLGASIGVSVYPIHGSNLTQLLKSADDAMYRVKKNGKSGYQVFGY